MEQLKKLVCSRASNEDFDVTVTYQRSAEAAATIRNNEGGGNMVKVYKSRNFEQAEIKVRISVPGKMGEQVLDAVRGHCRQQKRLCGDVFGYEIKIT